MQEAKQREILKAETAALGTLAHCVGAGLCLALIVVMVGSYIVEHYGAGPSIYADVYLYAMTVASVAYLAWSYYAMYRYYQVSREAKQLREELSGD